jgi:hypothetical protein
MVRHVVSVPDIATLAQELRADEWCDISPDDPRCAVVVDDVVWRDCVADERYSVPQLEVNGGVPVPLPLLLPVPLTVPTPLPLPLTAGTVWMNDKDHIGRLVIANPCNCEPLNRRDVPREPLNWRDVPQEWPQFYRRDCGVDGTVLEVDSGHVATVLMTDKDRDTKGFNLLLGEDIGHANPCTCGLILGGLDPKPELCIRRANACVEEKKSNKRRKYNDESLRISHQMADPGGRSGGGCWRGGE